MVKYNRLYLDAAIEDLKHSSSLALDQIAARNKYFHADAEGKINKSKTDLIYKRNISLGYRFLLISIGISIVLLVIYYAVFRGMDLYKDETRTVDDRSGLLTEIQTAFGSVSSRLDAMVVDLSEIQRELDQVKTTNSNSSIGDNSSGFSVGKLQLDASNGSCASSLSFAGECKGSHTFANGSTYVGTWLNGAPNGKGTLTFSDGGFYSGSWIDGSLTMISEEKASEIGVKGSITKFYQADVSDVDARILDLTAGHVFNSSLDLKWNNAYCYLRIIPSSANSSSLVTAYLSEYKGFDEPILLEDFSDEYGLNVAQFTKLQSLCPYRRNGFD